MRDGQTGFVVSCVAECLLHWLGRQRAETRGVSYVFGLRSLFQRSAPVQNVYADGVSDNVL